jgi:hypothetical protein
MKPKGGKREGAGRKSKAYEANFKVALDACFTPVERQKCLETLVKDCRSRNFHERHESRKLLLAYAYGKPTEKHEHANPDGSPLLQPVADALTKIYGSSGS